MLHEMLNGHLEVYKNINMRDRGRDFFNINDMQIIKDNILDIISDRTGQSNLSKLDKYYMNEILQVYEFFTYMIALIKKYKTSGYSSDLEEEYINFSDNYSDKIEFYLARLLLTGDEQTALRVLSNNNVVSKDYYYERIDFLLNFYRTREGITDDELFTLAHHINLPSNSFSRAIESYKRVCPERDREDAIKMYREVFVRNSDDNTIALEIINSKDKLDLVHKYIDNGVDDIKMYHSVVNIKGSALLSLTEEEVGIINKFNTLFKEEYKKLYPDEKELQEEQDDNKKKIKISYEEAKKVMSEFKNSIYNTKVAFCKSKDYSFEYFKECKDIYENGENTSLELKKENVERICNEIATGITLGIAINEKETRSFDIIDYYEITKYPPQDLYDELNSEIEESGRTKKKYKDNKNIRVTKEYLYEKDENYNVMTSMKITYNVEFDDNGRPIPNTGNVITKEESEKCLEYLKKNEIPVTTLTYPAAIKRYIKGYISFDEKVKVK